MATTARVKVGDDPPSNLAFGVANGVPGPLDGSGKVPAGQVPATGGSDSTALHAANNLSDVASATTSRTNLGLGTAATAAKVAAGAAGVLDATDPSVNKVASKLAANSATNTTSDTTLATATTIAAGSLTTNTVIRVDINGNLDGIATSGAFNIKIKINGTNVQTITVASSQTGSASALTWNFFGQLYVDATGVSGSVIWLGTKNQRTAAAAINVTPDQGAATTVDLSGGLTVTIVAAMATANAGNVLRLLRGSTSQVV